jgi:hypothetical protein
MSFLNSACISEQAGQAPFQPTDPTLGFSSGSEEEDSGKDNDEVDYSAPSDEDEPNVPWAAHNTCFFPAFSHPFFSFHRSCCTECSPETVPISPYHTDCYDGSRRDE